MRFVILTLSHSQNKSFLINYLIPASRQHVRLFACIYRGLQGFVGN
jgi:hypothetical protein